MPRPATTRVEHHPLAQRGPAECVHCPEPASHLAVVSSLDGRLLRSIPLCPHHLSAHPTS
jgi:hypothetical protein